MPSHAILFDRNHSLTHHATKTAPANIPIAATQLARNTGDAAEDFFPQHSCV
jgi:hypothetical protein